MSETHYHHHTALSPSQKGQYSLDLNKSVDLKLNLQSETFTHLFSNSSSLDEGVESDLSSLSSSISSDLLSLSRSPNGSILVSSFESKFGQKINNQPIYGILRKMTHKNSFCLSPGKTYRRQRFASFKRGLIKSPRIKNLNDLAEIKNELNFLIEDVSFAIKKNNLNNSLKKMSLSDISSSAPSQLILKKIKDSLQNNAMQAKKINENDEEKIGNDESQTLNHSHLFKCILKKTDEDFGSYFHEESLAQRRKHLLKQTSVSLNSVNEECASSDLLGNVPLQSNVEIPEHSDAKTNVNVHQQKILNTDFNHYHKNQNKL